LGPWGRSLRSSWRRATISVSCDWKGGLRKPMMSRLHSGSPSTASTRACAEGYEAFHLSWSRPLRTEPINARTSAYGQSSARKYNCSNSGDQASNRQRKQRSTERHSCTRRLRSNAEPPWKSAPRAVSSMKSTRGL
jgi:hypothetical protein